MSPSVQKAAEEEHGHDPLLHHHFDNMEQQRSSVELGMWLFLAQEVMFFGGLFLAYTFYRTRYHEAFIEASHHLGRDGESLFRFRRGVVLGS